MNRQLIFVHQYFAPEPAGSAQQLTDLALGLVEKGYSVQVVTGQPSYAGRGRLPWQESLKEVDILRVPKLSFSRNRPAGRILSAVSFFFSAFLKLLGMNRRALLVIGSDPPFLPLLGWFFRKVRGQKYVSIVSDIYPEVAVALGELGPESVLARLLEKANRAGYKAAQKVVVLTEKMAEHLKKKYPFLRAPGKIETIPNWADGNRIRPLEKEKNPFVEKHRLAGRFVVLYSGNLGRIYDFQDVVEASASLNGDGSAEFLFIGDGPLKEALANEVGRKGLKNIRFLPYQPEEVLPQMSACGDLALIPFRGEVDRFCIPGKLSYALAAGLPLLVIAPEDSGPAEIVRQGDCGWTIPPGNGRLLAELIQRLVREPSLLQEKKRKAREFFESCFTRESALTRYEALFSNS